MQCTLPHLCSCACLSAGHELAFFYPLGIIEAHEDDYIHGVFGGLFIDAEATEPGDGAVGR